MEKVPLLELNGYESSEDNSCEIPHECPEFIDTKREQILTLFKSTIDEESSVEKVSTSHLKSAPRFKYYEAIKRNQDVSNGVNVEWHEPIEQIEEEAKPSLNDVEVDTQYTCMDIQDWLDSTGQRGQNYHRYDEDRATRSEIKSGALDSPSDDCLTQVDKCNGGVLNRRRDIVELFYETSKDGDTSEVIRPPKEYTSTEEDFLPSPTFKSFTKVHSINTDFKEDNSVQNPPEQTKLANKKREKKKYSLSLKQKKDQLITIPPLPTKSRKNTESLAYNHRSFKREKSFQNKETDTSPGLSCSLCYYVTSCIRTVIKDSSVEKASNKNDFVKNAKSSEVRTTYCRKKANKKCLPDILYEICDQEPRSDIESLILQKTVPTGLQNGKNQNKHFMKKWRLVGCKDTSETVDATKQLAKFDLGSVLALEALGRKVKPRNKKEMGDSKKDFVTYSDEGGVDAVNNLPVKKKESRPLVDYVEGEEVSKIETKKILAEFNAGSEMNCTLYGEAKTTNVIENKQKGSIESEVEDAKKPKYRENIDTEEGKTTNVIENKQKSSIEPEVEDAKKPKYRENIDTEEGKTTNVIENKQKWSIKPEVEDIKKPKYKENIDTEEVTETDVVKYPLENKIDRKSILIDFNSGNDMFEAIYGGDDNLKGVDAETKKNSNETSMVKTPTCEQQKCYLPNCPSSIHTKDTDLSSKIRQQLSSSGDVMANGDNTTVKGIGEQNRLFSGLDWTNSSAYDGEPRSWNDTVEKYFGFNGFHGDTYQNEERMLRIEPFLAPMEDISPDGKIINCNVFQEGRSPVPLTYYFLANEDLMCTDRRRNLGNPINSRSVVHDFNRGQQTANTIYGLCDNLNIRVVKSHRTRTTWMDQNNVTTAESPPHCGCKSTVLEDHNNDKIVGRDGADSPLQTADSTLQTATLQTTKTVRDFSKTSDDSALVMAKVNKEKLSAGAAMADIMGGTLLCKDRAC
ncbi:hypothetical protein JTE90_009943 [Oedothorax gibbosus]|uniref:Uncharacterized protein n=1 Tax=Oedothorax gibbosus TaxID=931172 RepID=A0AAV6UIC9_9ARAC|nr:hypothetical protein JTE90_009943 [Oedothorax gibbosus]